jgi:two-component system OmpR family response regulator
LSAGVGKPRVLVVDDEELIAESLSLYLTGKNFDVVWAASAGKALSLIREGRFDILISDVFMAPMNGIELVKELRKYDKNCKVVMMSATVERMEIARQLAGLDIRTFIEKPFDPRSVCETLMEIMNETRRLQFPKKS